MGAKVRVTPARKGPKTGKSWQKRPSKCQHLAWHLLRTTGPLLNGCRAPLVPFCTPRGPAGAESVLGGGTSVPPAAEGEEGSSHHRLLCAKQNCISSRGETARQREGVKRPREGGGEMRGRGICLMVPGVAALREECEGTRLPGDRGLGRA